MLNIFDLSVSYGKTKALTSVSIEIKPAQIVGLLGPNGAGKSTLLRAIMGTTKYQGRIDRPAEIGYVPQLTRAGADYPLSVEHVVMTGRVPRIGWLRSPKKDDWAAVFAALERVSLSSLAKRPIGQLSGGQLQRVMIARALAVNPQILLLDEPFTGLDQPTQDLVSELLVELSAGGTAILMSTHDLAHATEVCDSLILLNQQVIAHGAPKELRTPQPWIDTFGVRETSPMMRLVVGK